jgi:hypothetical protein
MKFMQTLIPIALAVAVAANSAPGVASDAGTLTIYLLAAVFLKPDFYSLSGCRTVTDKIGPNRAVEVTREVCPDGIAINTE